MQLYQIKSLYVDPLSGIMNETNNVHNFFGWNSLAF